jgi:transposase
MSDPAVPPGGEELREAMLRALCVDHGHSRQEGGMNCRTCQRRVATLLALPEMRDALAAQEEAERRGYERGRRDFQFAPEGDNHHNAALCPYCRPALDGDS